MNRFISIICISFIFVLYACTGKRNYKDTTVFLLTDIPSHEILTGKMIEIEGALRPMRIYIKDSILFTIDNNGEYFVSSYHFLPEIQKIGDFIGFGSGPNEVLGLKSLQFADSSVWGFDRQRNKLNLYTSDQF